MSFIFDDTIVAPPLVSTKLADLRIRVSALLQAVVPWEPSGELALAYVELEKARMWMGNIMGEMGHPDPYQPLDTQRLYGNTREITPPVDVAPEPSLLPGDFLERTDAVRSMLAGFIIEVKTLDAEWISRCQNDSRWLPAYWEACVTSLILSRNYFGTYLSTLR